MKNAGTHPALQPRPLTPAQTADLVRRARAADVASRFARAEAARAQLAVIAAARETGKVRS